MKPARPKKGQELANDGLTYPDTEYFCKTRPIPVEPQFKAMEKVRNWARANSLWVQAFGTGCGAVELRPLMTVRFDGYRYGVLGVRHPASILRLYHRWLCLGQDLKTHHRQLRTDAEPEIRGGLGQLHSERGHVLGQL